MNINFENERMENMRKRLENKRDDGRFGRAFEIECARKWSVKTDVSAQGRADVHIIYNGVPRAAECKTNGGRIQSLYEKGAPKFVIYKLDKVQRRKPDKTHESAWEVVWKCDPVIIPTAQFLKALEECNAIKHTNGANDELAIQVFNRKFYQRLKAWPVMFSTTAKYTSSDFEDLEF